MFAVPPPHLGSASVQELVDVVTQQGKALNNGEAGAREVLLAAARSMVHKLEYPGETLLKHMWAEPSHHVVLRMSVELHLFDHLSQDGGAAKSSEQLATMCSAEPLLVSRMMKFLTAMGTVEEVGVDKYINTPFSLALTDPANRDTVMLIHDDVLPCHHRAPKYFAERNWTCPTDVGDCPFTDYYDCKGSNFFEYFQQAPELGRRFGSMMTAWSRDRPQWWDEHYYPVARRLTEGAKKDDSAVFLVDVAGGRGHDVEAFKVKHPNVPGRLILQDTPDVINATSLSTGIEAEAIDFNTPQQIHGARAYSLHSILHDWSDDQSRHILEQFIPAMEKGYSRLLVIDHVLPDRDSPWNLQALDWELMTFLSARERTEAQWRTLIETAGLKIVNIYKHPQGADACIELELP